MLISEAALGRKVDVKELVCPDCKKEEYTRDGWYHGRHEKRQRYRRTVCKRRFRDNLSFEYRQVPRLYITLALMVRGMGMAMAAANIQMTQTSGGQGARGHHNQDPGGTPFHYSKVVEEYARTVKPPCTGDKWGCDEKYQKVRGKESYVVAVMDLTTRFVLAWDISPTKEKYDAVPLLRAARDMAGRILRLFITDGLERYHIAFKKVFHMLKGPISIHIRDIHTRNLICNTNKQERLNGGLAGRFRYARGINKESLIFRMAILHYHSIRPHGGIAYRTPAEAAGIDIQGVDRSPTSFQNAVSTA